MENNLIFAPEGTKIKVDAKVLIVTGVHSPLIATVKHINHNDRCSLICDNGQSMDRYVSELKALVEDTTPTVGEVIQSSGDGRGQYDWVKTNVTIFEPKKFVSEIVIAWDEYYIKKKMQDFKAKLSVELRSEFVIVAKEWGDFNTSQAEQRAAEDAAGADL